LTPTVSPSSELAASVLTKENLILSGSTGNPDRNEAAIAALSSVAIGRKIDEEENTVTMAHGPNLPSKREWCIKIKLFGFSTSPCVPAAN
jgi:hypothetical protein